MDYKNVKVLEITPVVYLGEEFKDNNWRDNQSIFNQKIKGLNFKVGFGIECPIADLICVQVEYEDTLEPLVKEDTMDKIFSVINELLKVFKDVKINLYLDDFIEGGYNSVDLDIKEFTDYLFEELSKFELSK